MVYIIVENSNLNERPNDSITVHTGNVLFFLKEFNEILFFHIMDVINKEPVPLIFKTKLPKYLIYNKNWTILNTLLFNIYILSKNATVPRYFINMRVRILRGV